MKKRSANCRRKLRISLFMEDVKYPRKQVQETDTGKTTERHP